MAALFSMTFIAYAGYLVAFALCGVAIWRGDRPLKLAALVLIVAWTLSALTSHRDLYGMNYPITVIDTNCALVFVWISVRWRRIWAAVLAALTIVAVVIPLVAFFDRDIHRYNQMASTNIVAILQLVVMAVAIQQTPRGRRRVGRGDRSEPGVRKV